MRSSNSPSLILSLIISSSSWAAALAWVAGLIPAADKTSWLNFCWISVTRLIASWRSLNPLVVLSKNALILANWTFIYSNFPLLSRSASFLSNWSKVAVVISIVPSIFCHSYPRSLAALIISDCALTESNAPWTYCLICSLNCFLAAISSCVFFNASSLFITSCSEEVTFNILLLMLRISFIVER